MTIEWACTRLVNAYANANDAGDWQAVAALYADDGMMIRPSAADDQIRGRKAIFAAFVARPVRQTRHVCSNIVIDVESATAARGESAMLLFTGPGAPLVGGFRDRFVLTDEGWRFAARIGSLTFDL